MHFSLSASVRLKTMEEIIQISIGVVIYFNLHYLNIHSGAG